MAGPLGADRAVTSRLWAKPEGDPWADGTDLERLHRPRRSRRLGRPALVVLAVLVGAPLLACLVLFAVFDGYIIPSESMTPSLQPGDRVFVLDRGDPGRGDIIVFRQPGSPETFVKRAVAVAGDRVGASEGVLTIDGRQAEETYLASGTTTQGLGEQTIRPGSVFDLGDNRGNSQDSRTFGPIDTDDVVGAMAFRYWPPSRIGGV